MKSLEEAREFYDSCERTFCEKSTCESCEGYFELQEATQYLVRKARDDEFLMQIYFEWSSYTAGVSEIAPCRP